MPRQSAEARNRELLFMIMAEELYGFAAKMLRAANPAGSSTLEAALDRYEAALREADVSISWKDNPNAPPIR
jgi:hypothetical protein